MSCPRLFVQKAFKRKRDAREKEKLSKSGISGKAKSNRGRLARGRESSNNTDLTKKKKHQNRKRGPKVQYSKSINGELQNRR